MLEEIIVNKDASNAKSSSSIDTSDVAAISLVRKVIDNFLASNDEDVAHELIKWMEWKMSGLNLATICNNHDKNIEQSNQLDKNTSESSISSETIDTCLDQRDNGQSTEGNTLQIFNQKPLDSVHRLNCNCGNSFILRLSITHCDHSSQHDDISDTGDGHDHFESNVAGESSISEEHSSDDFHRRNGLSPKISQVSKENDDSRINKMFNANYNSEFIDNYNNIRYIKSKSNKRKAINPMRINFFENKEPGYNDKTDGYYVRTSLNQQKYDYHTKKGDATGSSANAFSIHQNEETFEEEFENLDAGIKCVRIANEEVSSNGCFHHPKCKNNDTLSAIRKSDVSSVQSYQKSEPIIQNGSFESISTSSTLIAPLNACRNGFCESMGNIASNLENSLVNSNNTIDESSREVSVEYLTSDGKRQFRCPICFNNYANRSGLNRHYVTHSPDDLWKAECHICGKKYSRKDSLKHHIKTQHSVGVINSSGNNRLSDMGRRSVPISNTIKQYPPTKVQKLDDDNRFPLCHSDQMNGNHSLVQNGDHEQLNSTPSGILAGCFSKESFSQMNCSRQFPRTESH